MRRSESAKYARWAAGIALAMVLTVAGVYAYRYFEAERQRRKAPPPVPTEVKQRSAVFSYSKVEGDRTLFTIRASRTTEFKEGSKAQLEDVWVTIYGRSGKRFDNVHTSKCDYVPATGRITCAGEARIDLESAEEAKEIPGQRVLHIGTNNVSFDRDTGDLHSDQPVIFRFPYGHGRGLGLTYSTRAATVRLHSEIELTLTSRNPVLRAKHAQIVVAEQAALPEPVVLTGGALEYARNTRILKLAEPVHVKQGARELESGELALEFDESLRARRLVAGGKPQLRSSEPQGQFELTASEIVALFDVKGWSRQILATGNVSGRLKDKSGEDRFTAGKIEIEMEPQRNRPRNLLADGNVVVTTSGRAGERRLSTAALRMDFGADRRGSRHMDRAESLAPGTVEFRESEEKTAIRADRFMALFDERNTIRRLEGKGNASVERQLAQRPPQQTTARELAVTFDPSGAWAEADLIGGVQFKESDRTAQADRARLVRATDLLSLSGSAVVADSLTRTSANTLSFSQRSGEIRGQGGVRTSYLRTEREGITNLAPQPAHLSADILTANRNSGRASYSGHARMWQGDAVIEAESIEMLRDEKRLDARGRVNALFPQAQPPRIGLAANSGGKSQGSVMWRVRAGQMSYFSAEGRARLQEDVVAESSVGQIQSRTLDLFLSAEGNGARQMARGLASGGVTIRQGDRRGTAERGEYVAAEGKFVLSGGKPTLFDAQLGTTSGRQLTFFLADDKILIDSEEGSRTLSRHRVEK